MIQSAFRMIVGARARGPGDCAVDHSGGGGGGGGGCKGWWWGWETTRQ